RDHHASFLALASFLRYNPRNRLVVMPGNHDADLFWPKVQSEFRTQLCKGSDELEQRLAIWLQPVYRPVGCSGLWSEHGHQYDAVNSFFIEGQPCWSVENPPIRSDEFGKERLYECLGTRFLIQFLNRLDADYPYVDNVKPFSRFLQIFGASALVPGFAPLRAAAAIRSFTSLLSKTAVSNPKAVLKRGGMDAPSIANNILLAFNSATQNKRREFLDELEARNFEVKGSVTIMLSNEAPAEEFML